MCWVFIYEYNALNLVSIDYEQDLDKIRLYLQNNWWSVATSMNQEFFRKLMVLFYHIILTQFLLLSQFCAKNSCACPRIHECSRNLSQFHRSDTTPHSYRSYYQVYSARQYTTYKGYNLNWKYTSTLTLPCSPALYSP